MGLAGKLITTNMPQWRSILQLLRLPAVFTAVGDVVLGFLLNHVAIGDDVGPLTWLIVASSSLYLSGMAFNDFFDRGRDAQTRGNRPIPSGRVSPRFAAGLASVLMLAGIAAASLVARQSLYIAVALAICVLLYDGVMKATPLAPLFMGGCRFLNVMLGAGAFDASFTVWATPQTYIASALGVYIVGVTWFARSEARASRPASLACAAVVVNLGLLALVAFALRQLVPALVPPLARVAGTGTGDGDAGATLLVLAAVAFTIDRRIFAALLFPSPINVQAAVKVMLLSIITLDAAMIYFKTGEPTYGLAIAALLVPAALLGRRIYVT